MARYLRRIGVLCLRRGVLRVYDRVDKVDRSSLPSAEKSTDDCAADCLLLRRVRIEHGVRVCCGKERVALVVENVLRPALRDALRDLLACFFDHRFSDRSPHAFILQLARQRLNTAADLDRRVKHTVSERVCVGLCFTRTVRLRLFIARAEHAGKRRPELRVLCVALRDLIRRALRRFADRRRCAAAACSYRKQCIGNGGNGHRAVLVHKLCCLAARLHVRCVFLLQAFACLPVILPRLAEKTNLRRRCAELLARHKVERGEQHLFQCRPRRTDALRKLVQALFDSSCNELSGGKLRRVRRFPVSCKRAFCNWRIRRGFRRLPRRTCRVALVPLVCAFDSKR